MYSFKSRIRYSEASHTRVLTPLSIVNYFQDCCSFESEDKGVGLDWLKEHDTAWMLTNWQVFILREPRFGEEIEIVTWACGFRYFIGKRSFLIKDSKGEVLVFAMSEWAYVKLSSGMPDKNVPQEELDAYGSDTPVEERLSQFGIDESIKEHFIKGKIDIRTGEWEEQKVIEVLPTNIDTNGHVNNAQYIDIALRTLPENINVSSFAAEYKQQAHLGDKLYPRIKRAENVWTVVLGDEEGKPMLIARFETSSKN